MLLTWPDLREERNSSMPLLRVPPRLDAAMDWIPRLVCCWAVTDGPNWKRAPPPVMWKLLIGAVGSTARSWLRSSLREREGELIETDRPSPVARVPLTRAE